MEIALSLAKKAFKSSEIPVGAVIVRNEKIISKGLNNRHSKNNVLGHAEIIALTKAQKKLKTWHLSDCEMYVTLKPCDLCEKVIKASRIKKVYYLLEKQVNKKEFSKTIIEKLNAYPTEEYKKMLTDFFIDKR